MEKREMNEEVEINLGEIFSILLSRIGVIILSGVVVGMLCLIFSKFVMTPMYTSSTKIYVVSREGENSNLTYSDLQVGSLLTKDYVELVKSRTVLTQVITELNLDMTTSALADMITVSNSSDTRIITIRVEGPDPYQAQEIANSVRAIASSHICNVMNLEAVNVVDEADIPTAPSSPNVMKNAIIGVLIGFLVAVAVVIISYMADDTIKTPDDVERYLGMSVLASIPVVETEEMKRKKKRKKNT